MAKRNTGAPVTKEMLDQAVDAILKGVERMFTVQDKKNNRRFSRLEAGQSDLKRQINDLKANTPTRKEFDDLKAKVVDQYHPLS